MLRRTITWGRPLVLLRVCTYSSALCVWPRSPSGRVPRRNSSPAFALRSMSSATLNRFRAARAGPSLARSRFTMPALTDETTARTSPVRKSFTSDCSREA